MRSARHDKVLIINYLLYNDRFISYPIKTYDKIDDVIFKNNLLLSNKHIFQPAFLDL
ncbi:chondroitinase-B domain-containing protein [uncultured Nonlabens sp.]|uniref:chondroitinase-B domain-containing protein n=1 Tax=uncultured Nonlabens sp. TaxID=859306 RepID=UPI003459B55B